MDDPIKTVKLEDFFEFDGPDDIRVKGHRIGIENILIDYLDGLSPIEIALRYPSLSLDEVEAAIEYYCRNREKMDHYLLLVEERHARRRAEQEANPPPGLLRLRALREESLRHKSHEITPPPAG